MEQCKEKLCQFWRLGPSPVIGIMKGLEKQDSFAAELQSGAISFEDILARKASAKERLQLWLGFPKDPDAVLLAFLGRKAHQKGCDIVAKVKSVPLLTYRPLFWYLLGLALIGFFHFSPRIFHHSAVRKL